MSLDRKILLIILSISALLLAGCGASSQPVTGEGDTVQSGEENTVLPEGGVYYTIEETTLPDPDRAIKDLLGEDRFSTEDPVLHGDCVYRYVYVFDEDGNHKAAYLQTMKLSDKEWKCISISDFEIEGKQYVGFQYPFFSESEDIYCYVYQAEEKCYYLGRLGEEGIKEILCPVPKELEEDYHSQSWCCRLANDATGSFYYFHKEKEDFAYLDGMLQSQKELRLTGNILDIVQNGADGEVYWYGTTEDGKAVIQSLTEENPLLKDFEGVDAYDYQAEFSSKGSLFLADRNAIWKIGEEPEEIFHFLRNDYIVESLYGMEAGENGGMELLVKLDGNLTLLKLQETDTPPTVEKQEIVLAFAMEHQALNKVIARFNRQSEAYHVSVMTPEADEERAAFRERIQLEISAGKGPDMLGHDVILDISPYVDNGYLECLDGVLVDESRYLQAALDSCRIDGKLYGLPYDCTLEFAVYPAAYTGGRTSWMLPEMMEAVQASGAKILEDGCSSMDIVKRFVLYDNSNTTYIDWEKGESHLTETPFLELLAFAKEYGDTGELYGEAGKLIADGEAFAMEFSMDDLYHMLTAYACFQGEPAIIGYPRAEGNGIYVRSRELYVNSSSEVKEGAVEFLRYLLSEETQKQYIAYNPMDELNGAGMSALGYAANFPIHMGAYEALMEEAVDEDKPEIWYTNYGVKYEDVPYTEEQVEQFYFLLENAQPAKFYGTSIYSMVSEELEPYFAGDVTAEQAAEKLDNRVQLYLDESK